MKNYKAKNRILEYMYKEKKGYLSRKKEFAHVWDSQLSSILGVNKKVVDTNLKWLEQVGEVKYEEFAEDMWGYIITRKGEARLSDPYTKNSDKFDKKLGRANLTGKTIMTWLAIPAAIIVFFQTISIKFSEFNLWEWIRSLF